MRATLKRAPHTMLKVSIICFHSSYEEHVLVYTETACSNIESFNKHIFILTHEDIFQEIVVFSDNLDLYFTLSLDPEFKMSYHAMI